VIPRSFGRLKVYCKLLSISFLPLFSC